MGLASGFDHLGQPDLLLFSQQRVAADVAEVQTDEILRWRLNTPVGQWPPFLKSTPGTWWQSIPYFVVTLCLAAASGTSSTIRDHISLPLGSLRSAFQTLF